MKNLSFAGGIAFMTLALVACGDDTGGTGSGGGSTASSTTSSSTTGASTTTGGSTTSATSSSTGEGAGPGTGGDSPAGTGGDSPAGTGGAGTGGDSGTGGAGTGGEAPSSVQEVPCDGAEIAETITNDGFTAFDPADTTINVDEIIEFAPDGPHTFTSDDGLFDTGSNETVCFRFTEAGEFPFHCSNHSAMVGTVTVE
jgi:plastocyanin